MGLCYFTLAINYGEGCIIVNIIIRDGLFIIYETPELLIRISLIETHISFMYGFVASGHRTKTLI